MNPTVTPSAWKTDNYKFVGKAFDYAYANYMNKLSPILGERNAKSVDYELTASGGYGELQPYDGNNLNIVEKKPPSGPHHLLPGTGGNRLRGVPGHAVLRLTGLPVFHGRVRRAG